MALLAETLVDEWLNRQKFFTVRGIKHDVNEIDLLAVRQRSRSKPEGWHVEVQVSFRPVTYVAPLTKSLQKELPIPSRSARRRSLDQLERCATAWVHAKFQHDRKASARDNLWQGVDWRYVFVHGNVLDKAELQLIQIAGVVLFRFIRCLTTFAYENQVSYVVQPAPM